MEWRSITKSVLRHKPLRLIVGYTLIIVGILALLTPLTPGSWLAIVGAELIGIRLIGRNWFSRIWKRRTGRARRDDVRT